MYAGNLYIIDTPKYTTPYCNVMEEIVRDFFYSRSMQMFTMVHALCEKHEHKFHTIFLCFSQVLHNFSHCY